MLAQLLNPVSVKITHFVLKMQFHPESFSSENVQFSLYSLSKTECVLLVLCRSVVCCSKEHRVCVGGMEALIS